MSRASGDEELAARAVYRRQALQSDRRWHRSQRIRDRSRTCLSADYAAGRRINRVLAFIDFGCPCDKQFDAPLEISTRQEHAPAAGLTLYADIGSKPDDIPIEPATWVRFLEPHDVANCKRDGLRFHHRARLCLDMRWRVANLPATSVRGCGDHR